MVDVKATLDRLAGPSVRRRYRLPDLSAGTLAVPIRSKPVPWQELRAIICGDPESRVHEAAPSPSALGTRSDTSGPRLPN